MAGNRLPEISFGHSYEWPGMTALPFGQSVRCSILSFGKDRYDSFSLWEKRRGYFSLGVTGFRWIKRFKGIWWMPWRTEAKKDVARCEKPRGGASTL